jgi:2-polyprenyl-3-methyl-5-hydroxy-6-metoxy-1,4-benzoquinol methylase
MEARMRPERFWDSMANKLDRTEKRLEQIFIKVLKSTKRYLKASDVVLDYGCGTGLMCNEIASDVKQIYAIDISSKMLDIAKRRAVERNIENVEFAQANIFDARYKRESFDVILAFGILHLLEDNRQVIQRISELLTPGGLFISSTPCLAEKMTLLTKLQYFPYLVLDKLRLIPSIKRYRLSEVAGLVATGRFQIVETENIFYKVTGAFIVAKRT